MNHKISCSCGNFESNDLLLRNEELCEANRNLEAALLSISHDLRNPLHIIMMDNSTLLEKCDYQPGSRERSSLERVGSAAQRMMGMINGLLGMCCIGGQAASYAPVDISGAVAAILAEFQRNEPQRPVSCVVREDVRLWSDSRLIHVVLVNLIGNSWKYTKGRQSTVIEFGTVPGDGGITCFIRDNGAGFDTGLADRLFLPFQRFHHGSEGTGIGLASVQRIITRLGGKVWAEGEKEKGATFYFTLPAVPPP